MKHVNNARQHCHNYAITVCGAAGDGTEKNKRALQEIFGKDFFIHIDH